MNEILEKLKQLLKKLVIPVTIQKDEHKEALRKKDPKIQARNDILASDGLNLEKFIDEYDFQGPSLNLLEDDND